MERSLCTEEHTGALASEVQSDLFQQNPNSAAELPNIVKRVQTILQQDSLARQELN